ncbi:MAG: hypothetical protein Q9199_000824 [Rusavskia elegans]
MIRNKIHEAIKLSKTQEDAPEIPLPVSSREPRSKRGQASAQRSLLVLNALINLEESLTNEKNNGASPTQSHLSERGADADISARKSILPKVRNVLNNLSETTKENAAASSAPTSPNLFSASGFSPALPPDLSHGVHEPDIIPVVLNSDPDGVFWEFLDFDPPLSPAQTYGETSGL